MATEENMEYISVNLKDGWFDHLMTEVNEAIEAQAKELDKAAQASSVNPEYVKVLKDNYNILTALKKRLGKQSKEDPAKIYVQDFKDLFWVFMWNTARYKDQNSQLRSDLEASLDRFDELKQLTDGIISKSTNVNNANKELLDVNKNLVNMLKNKAKGQEH